MHIAVKGIVGATTLGGIATGSYFVLKPNNANKEFKAPERKQTLKEILTSTEGFEALSTKAGEDATEWKEMIQKYHDTNTNKDEKKITVAGIVTPTQDNEAENIKKLQENCEKLFAKTEFLENDKKIVTNWCNKKSELIKKQPAT